MSDPTPTAYPLCWPIAWPRERSRIWRCPFKNNTFARARDGLGRELDRLGARDVILSTNVPLRIDGQPRGDFRDILEDPGVAVYFKYRGKPMMMARDAYAKVSDNLRSLAMAIEHLRGLDRHGGATMMERAFDGFAALPAPSPMSQRWRKVLGFPDHGITPTPADIDVAFRRLAIERHPDHGGSDAAMAELNAARDAAHEAVAHG